MNDLTRWVEQNWPDIVVPLAVFLTTYIAGLWIRRVFLNRFGRWLKNTNWQGSAIVLNALRTPFIHWFLILGIYLALRVSMLPIAWVVITGRVLGSLLVISIIVPGVIIAEQLISLYFGRIGLAPREIALSRNVSRGALLVIGLLIILDIWALPTTPIILIVGAVVLWGAFAFRDILPNLIAGIQSSATNQIKVGDYIKLETGEEGYVTDISWRNIRIESLEERSSIIVPNRKLTTTTVINYGRPLTQAKEPFHFYSRLHLKELTGLKARDLKELVDVMKTIPESVVYYHTHHYLEEHHFLTPEPSNDFALWVTNALGYDALGEKLASVDVLDFPTLVAFKERIMSVVEEALTKGDSSRTALHGREFYFIKTVSVIIPTNFVAHDLREFVEILRKISTGSIYFHIFESRLRLQKGQNDFSIWIEDSVGDAELASSIARLDPYFHTLEGLRSTLIQLLEKRIK